MKAEEYYKEYFGVDTINDNGTTINKSVIRFATDFSKSQQVEMVRVDENGDRLKEPPHIFSDNPDKEKSLLYQESSMVYRYNKARQIPLAQYELEQKLREVKTELAVSDLQRKKNWDKSKDLFKQLQQAKDEIERLNGYYKAELGRVELLRKGIVERDLEIERLREVIERMKIFFKDNSPIDMQIMLESYLKD